MGKNILAVIGGYVIIFIAVFISFTALYFILGTDGAFESGSFRISTTWLIFSLILSFLAAILGGYVCTLIAKNRKASMILAGVVVILGIIMAIPAMGEYDKVKDDLRESTLSNMEAMQNAKQPDAILILNPFLGALGVVLGSRLWKEKKQENAET